MTIPEQFLHFIIAEQMLNPVPLLLSFKESIYLVQSPGEAGCSLTGVTKMATTYSMNFPMLFSISGDRDSTVSALRWRLIIAYRTGWMFSMSLAHSSLFRFTFYTIL
jgi:hypothetical protein